MGKNKTINWLDKYESLGPLPKAQWGGTGDIASLPGVRKQIPLSKEQLSKNKKAVEERVKAENAKILADRKAKLKASEEAKKKPMSAKTLAEQTQAIGDKFRLFPNDPNSFIDDYLNPGVFIGDMASGLGSIPLNIQQNNYGQAAWNLTAPLAVGALAGLGAKTTGQFLNNVVNPLAGINLKSTSKISKVEPTVISSSVDNVTSEAKNLKDLQAAKEFAEQYGYELPTNLERIAQSDELTNRTVRSLMNRHNTFVRGVSTNWDVINRENPEILRHLENKGIDWQNNPKAAAEYMATHIPINTGYGRSSLNASVFERGLDGLYTSNSIPTAEGYTYGQGFITKVKKPTDFSSANRKDWITKNNPSYRDGQLENTHSFLIDDTDIRPILGKYDNFKNTYTKVKSLVGKPEKLAEYKNYILEQLNEDLLNSIKNPAFYGGDPAELLRTIEKTKKLDFAKLKIKFDETSIPSLLRTERSNLTTDPFAFLQRELGTANSTKGLTDYLKTQPYQEKIKELDNLSTSLSTSSAEKKALINAQMDEISKEVHQLYNQSVQDYMKLNHPNYNPVNNYAHYIHIGTPGEKVLEPIKSWEITPEIWKNKSRAHVNSYTKKLSALEKGGKIYDMKKKLKKYEIGGINEQIMPLSFDEWFKQQDLPPGADANMFKGMYQTYLNNFGVSEGFTKVGENKWQKQFVEEDKKGTLQYNDFFQGFNKLLDMTQLVAGTINDAKHRQDEKNRLLEARYPKSNYNVNQGGINNVPVYYQNGGQIPKMQTAGKPPKKKTLILAEADPKVWTEDRVKQFGQNPFITEAEGMKRYLNKYFPGEDVEIVPTYKENFKEALKRSDANTRLVSLAHYGDKLFGVPSEQVIQSISQTPYENCYAGTCYGSNLEGVSRPGIQTPFEQAMHISPLDKPDSRHPSSYNLKNFYLRESDTWSGFSPVNQGGEEGFKNSFFRRAMNPRLMEIENEIETLREKKYKYKVGSKEYENFDDKILKLYQESSKLFVKGKVVKNNEKATSYKKLDPVPYPARRPIDLPLRDFQNGGENNDVEMVNGIADILAQVKDPKNRREIAKKMIADFKREDVQYNYNDFMSMSKLKGGGKMPLMQDGGGWWDSVKRSLFGEDKPEPKTVTLKMPYQYQIQDKRKKSLTTGKDINPNVELLTGKYDSNRMLEIAKAAKRYDIDPYLAIAMDLQETGLGKKSDSDIGHVMADFDMNIPTRLTEQEDTGFWTKSADQFARAIASKMQYADRLGIKDEPTRIQTYNGLGTVYPETEQGYHGFKMKNVYGIPLPKEGIDMRKNPLYGKRIIDIRDNILKQDKNLDMYIRNAKKVGGPVSVKKAKEILKDGTIHGKPITEKQRGFFGFIAGGGKPKMQYAGMLNNAIIVADKINDMGAYVPTMQLGGGNQYVNTTGYLDGAQTAQNPYNIIPSNVLTMQGVSQDIMAYPNVGEPTKMKANDKNKYFFPNADYVIEQPASGNSLNFMAKGGKPCMECGGKVKMANGGVLQEMATGGIPERYKNLGFTKVGAKRKSTRPGKKWMVLAKKDDKYKVVHGGYKGMEDYTQHRNKKRQKNFWNRMGGKNSSKATDPFSPLYWHKRFGTWQEGGEVMQQQPNQEELMQVLQIFAEDNKMTIEELMAKLQQLPEDQMQKAIQDIVEDVQETMMQDDDEEEDDDEENGEPEVEVEEMQTGGLQEAVIAATKAANVPQDYKFIGEQGNKKYYNKNEIEFLGQLQQAKKADSFGENKKYENFVIGLLEQGYLPNELANKGYISKENIDKFSKYYVEPKAKNNFLYTEEFKPTATPVQSFEGENIYSGNKAFGKMNFKFRDATNADIQAGIVNTMSEPVKEFYFRKYKPNSAEIDYNQPMYKVPAKEWYNITSGTTNLSKPDILENFKMQQYQTGGIQQVGGVDRNLAVAELEKGEVFQDRQGGIKKVAESEPMHENGGSPQANVYKVLEDTADKRRDLDSRLLKIKPDEAEVIVGFKPKGSTTHSKLFEQATEFYGKKAKGIEKEIKKNYEYVRYANGGKYAQNSLDENLKLLQQIPTKADLFDIIYNHQEEVKGRYGISQEQDMMMKGGLKKYQPGGQPNYVEQQYQNQPATEMWGPLNTPIMPSWLNYWVKSNTPKGGISATTGAPTTYNPTAGNEIYDNYNYWRSLYGKNFEGPEQYQKFVFDTIAKEDPTTYGQIMQTWGMPTAGTLTDAYFGARTAKATSWRPKPLTPEPAQKPTIPAGPKAVPVDEQFAQPRATNASAFYEPLRWYDVAGTTASYLSALEREPVALEQLSVQPLQARELNALPVLQQNQAAFNAAMQQIPSSGVGMANVANLLGSKYSANAQVLGQYENMNKQAKTQMDMYNQQQQMAINQTNLGLRDQFAQRVLAGKEVQRQSKLNAFDDYMTKLAQNRKLNREGNLVLQMTPYFDQYGKFNGNVLGITNAAKSMGGNVSTQKTADGKTQYTVTDSNGQVIKTFSAKQ